MSGSDAMYHQPKNHVGQQVRSGVTEEKNIARCDETATRHHLIYILYIKKSHDLSYS